LILFRHNPLDMLPPQRGMYIYLIWLFIWLCTVVGSTECSIQFLWYYIQTDTYCLSSPLLFTTGQTTVCNYRRYGPLGCQRWASRSNEDSLFLGLYMTGVRIQVSQVHITFRRRRYDVSSVHLIITTCLRKPSDAYAIRPGI